MIPAKPAAESLPRVDSGLLRLRQMVVDAVAASNSKRNYAKALDHLFAFAAGRPLSRELLLAWRASMEKQSPSTVNLRLSAMRSLVAEARSAGMLSSEDAATLTEISNIKQAGTRKGNWLTREQAKEILAVPDRSKLKGKRDYVILSLLVACALRRTELAELDLKTIQEREGRWVLSDLEGKGRRIRTVAIPIWVKLGIDAWTAAADIKSGRLLRPIRKGGKIEGDVLSDWAVWSIVEQAAKQIGLERFGATISAGPALNFAGRREVTSNRLSFCSGTRQFRRPRGISGRSRSCKSPSMTT